LVQNHEMSDATARQAIAQQSAGRGRACYLVGADRTMVRCRSRRPDDAALRERMRALADERRRFGYRRLHVLLRQEGLVVNRKKTERLYREERLTVCRRRGRKTATGTRAPILVEARPNARWSVDFVHDQRVSGRRLRILNVIDDLTKECLGAIVDTSISGRRVARELESTVARRGKPELILSDHGTEFTSNAMLARTQSAGIASDAPRPSLRDVIAPGKPQQNHAARASLRDVNVRMRDELLNETLFFSLDAAHQHLARWVADDNHRRPHSAIGCQTPAAYAARLTATGGPLRGTETLRQQPVAPSAPKRHSETPTPVPAG
ncbi:MAG: IS3 family transposase, partial [Pseudomonadota bacterium]